ncbi:MAG: manganese efflux pump [Bacteroidales bacterium]|nr:manganese efflux pump [Bacteroidales bacterium]
MEVLKSILEALLLGLSLSADCFAVSLCSSTGLHLPGKSPRSSDTTSAGDATAAKRSIAGLASAFAITQTGLLLAGWLLGHVFRTFFESRISHFEMICSVAAFVLLMFVAVEMFLSALRGKTEKINLSSARNIIIGAVATSIDALTVGLSLALSGMALSEILPSAAAVLVVTAVAVVAGILSGSALGRNYGRTAVFTGSAILAAIAVYTLLF